ncbi:murein hydrolase activator EnvC family protein [Xanthobacter agilis]|uniref:Septal ring factor EnvC (AmiA/AmiB activator) n=1 Tax=Xanthobacter agilis TaxID=47492 RepID=A0ABU0L8L0_XANAG|nr:peptidoglycan DD-metalloendopeptidase family protein [Xanthobacter agilis]MDQ0503487.1 septal ring factor EnvC (AmiA/AmiB activator) [Xanthobacter agilis]
MMRRSGLLLCACAIGLAGPVTTARGQDAPGVPPAPAPFAPAPGAQGAARPPLRVPLPPASPVRRGLDTDALKADVRGSAEFQKRIAAELDAAKGDRAKLNTLLLETADRSRAVELQLIDVEGRIGALDLSAAQLSASLAKRRDVLAEVLAALLRMGRNPPPALLMRPDDALDAVRSAILLGALLPELRVEAETLAADLSDLVRVRGELTAARESLGQLRTALDQDKKRLAALVGERQRRQAEAHPLPQGEKAQVDSVAKTSTDVHDLVTRMESEAPPAARAADAARAAPSPSAAAKSDLAALQNPARIAPAVPFIEAKGLLPLPVAGVRVRDFGAPDDVGAAAKGLSIATRAGAQVTAPADGWVVYAGPFRSYGQLLIINAGDGYHILMAGMEKITVDLGQFVLAGEPVGIMGGLARMSPAAAGAAPVGGAPIGGLPLGTASGQPQLYVEFRKDGNSIDPAPWWAATDSRKVRG